MCRSCVSFYMPHFARFLTVLVVQAVDSHPANHCSFVSHDNHAAANDSHYIDQVCVSAFPARSGLGREWRGGVNYDVHSFVSGSKYCLMFQVLLPPHCVEGTSGAQLHPDLYVSTWSASRCLADQYIPSLLMHLGAQNNAGI